MANTSSWNAIVFLLVLIGAIGVMAHTLTEIEIEKILKKLNKPAIKTIEGPDGDIVDCVDIYDQPAFDHPLLKNHTIEMRPSFSPDEVERGNCSDEFSERIWWRHGKCPKGTIPIRRVLKSDIVRSESSEIFGVVYPNPIGPRRGRLETAGATMSSHQSFYNGAGGTMSIWEPTVATLEYTGSLIHVRHGVNFITVGWMVDSRISPIGPRLFMAYTNNNRLCVNLNCPGFVQYNPRIVLGSQLIPSTIGQNPSTLRVSIRKSISHPHWDVSINGEGIGYFPFLVVGFDRPNILQWGGHVYNTGVPGQHTTTQMGSGRFPIEGYRKSAHFQNINYCDENNVIKYPMGILEIVAEYPYCYNAFLTQPLAGARGPTVFFGGWGGLHCDQMQTMQ